MLKGDNLHVLGRSRVFNTEIFSDTIHVINVTLYMVVLHIKLYLFITPPVTLTYFKVTEVSNSFKWKFYVQAVMDVPQFFTFAHI